MPHADLQIPINAGEGVCPEVQLHSENTVGDGDGLRAREGESDGRGLRLLRAALGGVEELELHLVRAAGRPARLRQPPMVVEDGRLRKACVRTDQQYERSYE